MNFTLRTTALLVCSAATLVLAACSSSDSGTTATSTPPPTPSTASALAMNQIDAQTCDNNDPETLNGRSISEDDDETDVTMLTPACTAQ